MRPQELSGNVAHLFIVNRIARMAVTQISIQKRVMGGLTCAPLNLFKYQTVIVVDQLD
jgi:hypothetical protein